MMCGKKTTSNGVELDDFHGQLYCVGAIVSGLVVADGSGIISTYSDEATLLETQVLVAFLAYFGTILIGQFIQIHADRIGRAYEKVISKVESQCPRLSYLLPLSGEFGKYQVGWILGGVFALLILVESFVGTKWVATIYSVVLLLAVFNEYRKEDTPEPSIFFRTLLTVTVGSTISTYMLVWLAPHLVVTHQTVGPIGSVIISSVVILGTLFLLQMTRTWDPQPSVPQLSKESLQIHPLPFHFTIGLSFPIIVTTISIIFYLLTSIL